MFSVYTLIWPSTKTEGTEKYSDKPLLGDVESDDIESGSTTSGSALRFSRPTTQASLRFPLLPILAISVILNLVLGFVVFYQDGYSQDSSMKCDAGIEDSPVAGVISYETKKFTLGDPDEHAPFIGHNSTEVDQLWEDLYGSSLYHIERSKLNKLIPGFASIPGKFDNHYLVGTYVFHQLHCINLLRKLNHPEMYPPDPNDMQRSPEHLDHCIEQLRQSAMCAGDVTPMAWRWEESVNDASLWATLPHTCRNFDKIQDFVYHGFHDLDRLRFENEIYFDRDEDVRKRI